MKAMTEMTPETLSEALWASGHCRFCGQLRMHHPGCKGKKLVSAWEADRQRIEALMQANAKAAILRGEDLERIEALERALRKGVEYFEADYDQPDWFDEAVAALAAKEKP